MRRILILCEDTKGSRDYFARFSHDRSQVEIDCVGTGMNTDSLMENAIKRAQHARRGGSPYERVWVVFDRDSFPDQNFNRAFDLSRAHNEVTPCWTNECFELWYLLHFNYRDTLIGREQMWRVISRLIDKKYDKADETLYEILEEKLEAALRNAKMLAFANQANGTPLRNPSTRVHELVDALRALDPAKQENDP